MDAVDEISRTSPPPSSTARRPMAAQWAKALEAEIVSAPPADADPWSVVNARLLVEWASRAPEH
ncbi:hypothetical protein K7G98_43835, partial [Saccharothrix sp. MB29]|nr:hypothetical protein [Saccharothrix sp. MB29]